MDEITVDQKNKERNIEFHFSIRAVIVIVRRRIISSAFLIINVFCGSSVLDNLLDEMPRL